jgi:sulfopyruvate decarboxylase alpha subunit
MTDTQPWADEIFDVLKQADVRQVAYVPDAGHIRLIERSQNDPTLKTIALTTEEEGIGIIAGAWLGGERGVLLMQSSGVGNCINMLSMIQECRFPFLTLVTMRGQWGEFNPWQVPMGQGTKPVLENMGIIVQPVDTADTLAETVAAAAHLAFDTFLAVAVLFSQRIIGFKNWGDDQP